MNSREINKEKPTLSVIIPTINEGGNIEKLVGDIESILSDINLEFIIVDDNSTDDTLEAARRGARKSKLTIISNPVPKGFAASIGQGIKMASHENLLIMDGDYNHHPSNIPKLYEELHSNTQGVIGSRFVSGGGMRPFYRYLGSYLFCKLVKIMTGIKENDSLFGFLLLPKASLANLPMEKIFSGHGEYCFRLLYYLNDKGVKLKEVGIAHSPRFKGQSKNNIIKVLLKYLKALMIFSIKIREGN